MIRLSVCLTAYALSVSQALAADDAQNPANGDCLQVNVAAGDAIGDGSKQHFRIVFQNRCDALRIVYWCAEHPSKTLTAVSVCSRETSPRVGIAAPLYAVVKQREFQWSFPPGTRIRYVSCNESSYPTSDFRCTAPTAKLLP